MREKKKPQTIQIVDTYLRRIPIKYKQIFKEMKDFFNLNYQLLLATHKP